MKKIVKIVYCFCGSKITNFTIVIIDCITKQAVSTYTIATASSYIGKLSLISINQRLSNVTRLNVIDGAGHQLRNLLTSKDNVRFAMNGKMRVITRKFD